MDNANYERDYGWYKKRMGLEPDAKVFGICGSNYQALREAFLERGWFENKAKEGKDATFFDFRWSWKANDVWMDELMPHQGCNHFNGTGCLTTKVRPTPQINPSLRLHCCRRRR